MYTTSISLKPIYHGTWWREPFLSTPTHLKVNFLKDTEISDPVQLCLEALENAIGTQVAEMATRARLRHWI